MTLSRLQRLAPQVLSRICQHPFNMELQQGTLPRDKFKFFLEQDSFYLSQFAEALGITSRRLQDPVQAKQFAIFAERALKTELKVHHRYLGKAKTPSFFQSRQAPFERIPVVASYTEHLLATARHASIEEAVLSLFPCFGIYKELGKLMHPSKISSNNFYRDWIASYSSENFLSAVDFVDQVSENFIRKTSCPMQQQKMLAALVKSASFEEEFFNAVYYLDNRPVLKLR